MTVPAAFWREQCGTSRRLHMWQSKMGASCVWADQEESQMNAGQSSGANGVGRRAGRGT